MRVRCMESSACTLQASHPRPWFHEMMAWHGWPPVGTRRSTLLLRADAGRMTHDTQQTCTPYSRQQGLGRVSVGRDA